MYRENPFVNGEYYHVYNRGVAKLPIFHCVRHYVRFERTLTYYQSTKHRISFSRYLNLSQINQLSLIKDKLKESRPIIEVIAYTLMPNHFHLVLMQREENGISNYLRLVQNSYTRYYNTVKHRVGSLFQGPFKAKRIDSNEYLLHVTRYCHLNPVVAGLIKKIELTNYRFSSYPQYLDTHIPYTFVVNPSIVLNQFSSINSFELFCMNHADYGISLEKIKHLCIDGE